MRAAAHEDAGDERRRAVEEREDDDLGRNEGDAEAADQGGAEAPGDHVHKPWGGADLERRIEDQRAALVLGEVVLEGFPGCARALDHERHAVEVTETELAGERLRQPLPRDHDPRQRAEGIELDPRRTRGALARRTFEALGSKAEVDVARLQRPQQAVVRILDHA